MPFTLEDIISEIETSHESFYKHLKDIGDEQWTWKPYPECKSITETISHLIINNYAAISSLKTGKEPDYESFKIDETDPVKLIELQKKLSKELIEFLESAYAHTPLDAEVRLWGSPVKLGALAVRLSSEYHYHAGQVAFIRMATNPEWNYYGEIYGGE
jgi:uncharacterized damage-inducible protein DinB